MTSRTADQWAIGAAVVAAIVAAQWPQVPAAVGYLIGVPLALLLPGYAVSRALFGNRPLDMAERTLLAVALSLAVLVVAGLAMQLAAFELTRLHWAIVLAGVTCAGCIVGLVRAPARPARPLRLRAPRLFDPALIVATVTLSIGTVGLARAPLAAPDPAVGYTELWLTPRDRTLQIGVMSHELARAKYRLELAIDGETRRRWRLSAMPGDRWTASFRTARLRRRGTRLEARLYRLDRPSLEYRRVRLRLP